MPFMNPMNACNIRKAIFPVKTIDKLFNKHLTFPLGLRISFFVLVGKIPIRKYFPRTSYTEKVKDHKRRLLKDFSSRNNRKSFIYKTDLNRRVFYRIIHVDMVRRAMRGRLWSVSRAPLFSAIALRPRFFLSISKILKNVLGRLLYFFMMALKFDGIFVHWLSSKFKMTPMLFFAKMHTSTPDSKSMPSSSELEMLPMRAS